MMKASTYKSQSGAVLLIGMLMLLVLSLIVMSASRNVILQQKMTNHLRDKELAKQVAESALKEAEHYLMQSTRKALSKAFSDDENNGLYQYDPKRKMKKAKYWQKLNTKKAEAHFQVKENAEYIIELLPDIKPSGNSLDATKPNFSKYYRVTAKARGGTNSTMVTLQSVIKK